MDVVSSGASGRRDFRVPIGTLARTIRPQLRAAQASSDTPAPPRWSLESVVDAAGSHGVTALLPPVAPWSEAVSAARRAAVARYARTLSDVAAMRDALDGVPWVIVKGAVLAHELYPRPDLRPFADADVLVPPARLGDVLSALESAGAVCLVRNWRLMSDLGLAEITLSMPAGTQVDLHWSLVNRAHMRRHWQFSTSDLLASSRPTGLLPGVRTLSDVDALVHVAWHCTRNGAVRLLWLVDVELAAARVRGSVHEVLAAAARTGTLLAVGVALDRAAIAFPGGDAARLAAAFPADPWRSLNRRVGQRVIRRSVGRSGAAVALATRRDTPSSLLALSRRGKAVVADETLGDEGGGSQARAEYVRWVEAQVQVPWHPADELRSNTLGELMPPSVG